MRIGLDLRYNNLLKSVIGGSFSGGFLPIAPLGVNLSVHEYYSAVMEYENLALYDKWSAPTLPALVPPNVDKNGNMLVSSTTLGVADINKVIGFPRNAGSTLLKATWTVTSGTPTVTLTGGMLSSVSYSANQGRATYTFTEAQRGGLPDARIRVAGGTIGNLEIRECDAGGNWLYPTERFNPAWLATISRYAGGYIRFMDWMNTNNTWRGTGATGGWRMDWADRAVAPGSTVYSGKVASVTLGTGNAALTLTATDVIYQALTQTTLGTILPKHWHGGAGNNLRVTINTPAGAGSASYTVVGDLIKVVLTPPSTATTAGQIRAWITNADVNLQAVFFNASLPATSDGTGTFVPVVEVPFTGGGYNGALDGIPLEDIIEVCDLANVRPWICLPTSASVDYATGFGTLLNTLPAKCRPARLEFSNEPWNTGFAAYHSLRAEGLKAGFADPHTEQHAARVTELHGAISAVYPAADFKWVLGGQSANSSYANTLLSKFTPSAATYIDRLAGAPYYNFATYTGSETADQILDAQFANINSTLNGMAANETVALSYGLEGVDLYEGGVHTVIPNDLPRMQAVARSARNRYIGAVYTAEIRRRFPNAVFCYYNDVNPLAGTLGYQWGLAESYNASRASSPKLDGFLNVQEGTLPAYYEGIASGLPIITGDRLEGAVLTVSQPADRNVTTRTRQWKRDGVPIPGETGLTYLQVAGDVGTVIECESTISNATSSYVTTTTGSAATDPIGTVYPSYTFLGTNNSGNSTNVHTFAVDIGTPSADRYILLSATVQNADPVPVSVTVAGVALTLINSIGAGNDYQSVFYGGLVTTGSGVQNAVVTWTSAAFEGKIMTLWSLLNLTSTTPKLTGGSTATSPTLAPTVAANDLVFFAANASSGLTTTFAGTSTPPPNGQRRVATPHYTADWLITSSGTLTINSPAQGAQRNYVVFG